MSTRFAGSRHLDERRRRRLAVESEETPAESSRGASVDRARAHTGPRSFGPALTHFPLRKLISRRQWKLWLVIVAVALAGASVVVAGASAVRPDSGWPAAATTLLAPSGPVARTFSGTLLLIGAQLAVVIWWARSRSLGDFNGRYRVWMWAAATWFAWAFCLATGGHAILGATAQELWPLDVPAAATLYWLAPAALWLLLLLRAVNHETSECRTSRVLLWLGATATAGSAGLVLAPEWTLPGADRATVEAALATAGPVLMFAALLQHARHVIYATPEPPPRGTPVWRHAVTVLRFAVRLVRIPAFRTDSKPSAGSKPGEGKSVGGGRRAESRRGDRRSAARPAAASADDRESASPPIEPPRSVDAAPSDNTASRQALRDPPRQQHSLDHAGAPDDDHESRTQAAADSKSASAPAGVRIDAPVDKNLLKGLSKRERRQLRKQLKDERRRAAESE